MPPDEPPSLPPRSNGGKEPEMEMHFQHIAREIVSHFESDRNPAETAIVRAITTEHLTTILSIQGKDLDNKHEYRMARLKHQPQMLIGALLISLLTLVIIIIAFLIAGKSEQLMQILIPIITMIVGALGGFGYGRHTERKAAEEAGK